MGRGQRWRPLAISHKKKTPFFRAETSTGSLHNFSKTDVLTIVELISGCFACHIPSLGERQVLAILLFIHIEFRVLPLALSLRPRIFQDSIRGI